MHAGGSHDEHTKVDRHRLCARLTLVRARLADDPGGSAPIAGRQGAQVAHIAQLSAMTLANVLRSDESAATMSVLRSGSACESRRKRYSLR